MDALSAAGASALEVGGAMFNNRLQTGQRHDAQNFSAQQYATRYQTQVRDLQAAGLNPMLAYMQSPGSAPQSSAQSTKGVEPGKVYNEHRIATAQEANIVAQTEKTIQDAKTSKAQEKNINADTTGKLQIPDVLAAQIVQATSNAKQADALTIKIQKEARKVEEEINHVKAQIQKNKSDVSLNNSLIELNQVYRGLRQAETFLTDARTRSTSLEGDIMTPKARAAKSWTGTAAAHAGNIDTMLGPFSRISGMAKNLSKIGGK